MCMMNEQSASLKRSLQVSSCVGAPPLKVRRIMSELPQRMNKKDANTSNDSSSQTKTEMKPQDYLVSLLESKGTPIRVSSALAVEGFFADPTEEEIKAYSHDVLTAIRTRDIEKLREFHQRGRPLKCSNNFGESLLHLACRRGFADVVDFLINEAGVTVQVRDDYGRTPLHDACWTCTPNFELVELIMKACPDLLLMKDKRGACPLEYARAEQFEAYNAFLKKRQDLLLFAKDDYRLKQ